MAKTKQYCVAENWGKGFIQGHESGKFSIVGLPGNVLQVPVNNKDANLWIYKILGTPKTLSEAQAIVDAEVTASQAAWDALPDAQKAPVVQGNTRPGNITLEE